MVPNDYAGAVMELAQSKRGEFDTMDYLMQIGLMLNITCHYQKLF